MCLRVRNTRGGWKMLAPVPEKQRTSQVQIHVSHYETGTIAHTRMLWAQSGRLKCAPGRHESCLRFQRTIHRTLALIS